MSRFASRIRYLSRVLFNAVRQLFLPAAPVAVSVDQQALMPLFAGTTFNTIIDVGAHTGEFSMAAHALAPQATIVAFEPLPGPFASLSRMLAAVPSTRAFPFALGDRDEETYMIEFPFTPCSSLLPRAPGALVFFPYLLGGKRRAVRVRRLDDVLPSVVRPALLKIDVQGFEDRVLRGATRTLHDVDAILIETSRIPVYQGQPLFDDVRSILESSGFAYDRAVTRHRGFFGGTVVQEDSLFIRQT